MAWCHTDIILINTLRPRQNAQIFPDDIFKCIFLNENVYVSIKISLKFVPKGHINYTPALVQIMAWCWPGNKPLSETVMVSLLTHICVTQPWDYYTEIWNSSAGRKISLKSHARLAAAWGCTRPPAAILPSLAELHITCWLLHVYVNNTGA